MIHLVTFSDQRMTVSAKNLCDSAIQYGCNSYSWWREEHLPEWLYNHHPEMVKDSRGFGWYAWKPFIVAEEIMKMNDGDILIYADAGQTLKDSVNHVIEAMDSDVFLFNNGWNHVDWCKYTTLDAILHFDDFDSHSKYDEYKQPQASLIFFRVSKESKDFCREWLAWSLMPGLIDNSPSQYGNRPNFQEHRWDQAILGCMAINHNIALHWFPSTTGHHIPRGSDKYPEITNHHRKRNNEW